jgi:hypothetical protein
LDFAGKELTGLETSQTRKADAGGSYSAPFLSVGIPASADDHELSLVNLEDTEDANMILDLIELAGMGLFLVMLFVWAGIITGAI